MCFAGGAGNGQPAGGGGGTPTAGVQSDGGGGTPTAGAKPAGNLKLLLCVLS